MNNGNFDAWNVNLNGNLNSNNNLTNSQAVAPAFIVPCILTGNRMNLKGTD